MCSGSTWASSRPAHSEMSLLVEKLNVHYGKSHVIFDLDLSMADSEVLTLLGRNGAGKTTSLLGILGLVPGTSGTVSIAGSDVSALPTYRRSQAGLAYVPSGARCFPNLTVLENLDIAAQRRSSSNGAAPARWNKERVFELFPALAELKANLAGGLSGGERQMLAVGRALMSNPKVILMDEPTEGLAPVIVQSIGRLVQQLKQTGVGILLAEQNHQMALKVADRAAFMEKGRIVEEMPATQAVNSEVLHRILGV
ncbi:MAG: ABC transporter ATP-binding protein [Chloroflexi bacterium]|nr:MAG: ABC transporter ATP-binding protein [Chloroflexota bacterium]